VASEEAHVVQREARSESRPGGTPAPPAHMRPAPERPDGEPEPGRSDEPHVGGRPLWQVFLVLLTVAFTLRAGAVAAAALVGSGSAVLGAAYGFQAIAGLATAVALWRGAAWVLGALIALAAGVVATAFVESLVLGVRPFVTALSEALVVAVSAGALFFVLRRELADR